MLSEKNQKLLQPVVKILYYISLLLTIIEVCQDNDKLNVEVKYTDNDISALKFTAPAPTGEL